jgi:lactate permease
VSWPWWAVLVATVPILLLALLVLRTQPVTRSAWVAAGVAGILGLTVFGLDAGELARAVGRGAWTGTWILLIVLPALLLFEVVNRSGALEQLGRVADQLAPTDGRQLLLLAFVLPSFLQGAAGFGAPIAMAAPMLVRRGMAPVAAVAACLIGYQWSVTFGSMGSSYFMAEATARLGDADAASFALRAGIVLGISAVVSGLLVLRRGRHGPGDLWRALVLGVVMAVTLVAVVSVQPALGSTAAGLAGLFACWWLLPHRGAPRPSGRDPVTAAAPYIVLTVTAAVGFALPPVRSVFERVPELAPRLPVTEAAFGFTTTSGALTPAFRPLLHPLPYLLLALLVAVVVYRRRGWWAAGTGRDAAGRWMRSSRRVVGSILGLTVLAGVLTDAGMISALAEGLARGLGRGFVAVSAPLGALGTVLTGSTTASNALFASLQAEVALTLGLPAAVLLAGQTAGGNLGNAIAPAVAAVGGAAAGAARREGEVIRRNLVDVAILTAVVLATLVVQVWLLR